MSGGKERSGDRLSALDDDFFALEGSADADERLNAYLRANPI